MRCWYARWQMSNALDRGDLASRMDRGHVARCAACQAFGRALTALDARLSAGARSAAPPQPSHSVVRRPRRPWLVAAPIAALAAAVLVFAIGPAARRTRPAPEVPAMAVAGPDTFVVVSGVADRVTQAVATTPLDAELDALLHDGKRGLDAVLAAGGLP
jgi:hypothetical protein